VAVTRGRLSTRGPGRASSPWAAAAVVALTALWTIPTFGLLVTSLRPSQNSAYSGWWVAFVDRTFTLENYQEVLSGGQTLPTGIWPYIVNSVVIALPVVVIGLVLACMAAYALVWLPFRGAGLVLAGIVALQVVPVQMALVPLSTLYGQGWSIGSFPIIPRIVDENGRSLIAGTYVPLWLTHLMFMLPLMVFLLHAAVAQLPRELFDAARVDGAAHVQIFRHLVMPLVTPMLASLAIFVFLWIWNDLIVAITFSTGSADVSPVTAYLAVLKGGYGQQEHLLTAGAFVAMVIPLSLFFALQRYFVRGLLAGSVEK
jgi:alpha-glucoside transport system permease protein